MGYSCYSFCTASANADRICWTQGAKPVLSPQEILDCGKGFVWFGSTGCDGGDPYRAAQLVKSNGLPTASSTALSSGCRSYRCYSGTCDSSPTCNVHYYYYYYYYCYLFHSFILLPLPTT
jgi:hypothetical protein